MSRALANLSRGFADHIVILGRHGIGKTHFLKSFYSILSSDSELLAQLEFKEIMYINGISDFKSNFVDTLTFSEYFLGQPEHTHKRVLLFVDDLDVICEKFGGQVPDLFNNFAGMLIGTWNIHSWEDAKRKHKLPKSEKVVLTDLTLEDSVALLNLRISQETSNKNRDCAFNKTIILKLAKIFGGNPYRLLTFAKRFLDFLIDNNIPCSQEGFNRFMSHVYKLTPKQIEDKILELTPREREVYSSVSEVTEVTTKQIQNKFNFSRISAFKHLQSLCEQNLLHRKKKGQKYVYYIPSEIVEMIDFGKFKLSKNQEEDSNDSD